MLCCFPLTFWLLILAFRVGRVVSLNTNMNAFYHQNFPRSLVIFSWKLSSGCVFTFLFLLSCGGATHSVGFLGLSGCAPWSRKKKKAACLMQPERQGNHGKCCVLSTHIYLRCTGASDPAVFAYYCHPWQWHRQGKDPLQKNKNAPPWFLFQGLRSSRAPANVSSIWSRGHWLWGIFCRGSSLKFPCQI